MPTRDWWRRLTTRLAETGALFVADREAMRLRLDEAEARLALIERWAAIEAHRTDEGESR